MAIVKIKGSVAKNLRGSTDWARLKKMTDAEIKAAVASDPQIRVIDDSKVVNFKKTKG
jgi:hypothetical protein